MFGHSRGFISQHLFQDFPQKNCPGFICRRGRCSRSSLNLDCFLSQGKVSAQERVGALCWPLWVAGTYFPSSIFWAKGGRCSNPTDKRQIRKPNAGQAFLQTRVQCPSVCFLRTGTNGLQHYSWSWASFPNLGHSLVCGLSPAVLLCNPHLCRTRPLLCLGWMGDSGLSLLQWKVWPE